MPTSCMLLKANAGVPEFGVADERAAARDPAIHAHARAREIIELFCPGNQKWAIGPLIAATIPDCRSVPEVSEPVGESTV